GRFRLSAPRAMCASPPSTEDEGGVCHAKPHQPVDERPVVRSAVHSKKAMLRHSMLSRGCALGRLVAQKAVGGTRQAPARSLSWNLKSSASSRTMLEKYHQR